MTRPEMYAQNPGSLEDQICLVSSFLSCRISSNYARYTQKITGTTVAVGSTKTMQEMQEFLRQFWEQDDEVEFFREWIRRSNGTYYQEDEYVDRYCDFRDQYERLGVFWSCGGPKGS